MIRTFMLLAVFLVFAGSVALRSDAAALHDAIKEQDLANPHVEGLAPPLQFLDRLHLGIHRRLPPDPPHPGPGSTAFSAALL